ncbi:MAG: hemerythrin domain-containing protein [Rhodospirillaceae bacterium]
MGYHESYSLSNQRDHEEIVVIGGELLGVMTNPMHDRARVAHHLSLLKSSLLTHFADEESEMKAHHYINFGQHKRSHVYIISILTEFSSAFAVGREKNVEDLWPHLENTLDNHLARYDAEFAAYLAGVGS